ncbi:YqaA family protein [Stagnihabitans tardus]|uniref:DedA family protein n=1 Tax=Stagnihabitans tardus TaxID=2699202 RepID=A0AAE5BWX0_9RHOB|nr:YqaA family protein [Stagnihabitans tardus]NBZ89752.1 DedA family protein [Stagnihabitans tardus]
MFARISQSLATAARSPRAEPILGLIAFAESSFFPVPAEIMFLPMCLARPERAMRYAVIAGAASVLGGIFGWVIGHYLFELVALPLLDFWGKAAAFEALKDQTGVGMLLLLLVTSGVAHLPPMKVVTILAGVVGFNLWLFIAAAMVARFGKYLLLGWALARYGAAVADVIKKRLALVAGLVIVVALAYLFLKP